ncbi:DoxX family membrane protein [Microlunatus soli]|uniref:DoxX protein n=1 Tax=Microlunatus soli TaxID=630515 RepID=A0A1H1XEL0_9ACTN|nr:DoxX family membrane protein [Microlunatus soli]SDT07678.1 DoxX protein [Microlunatus soli]
MTSASVHPPVDAGLHTGLWGRLRQEPAFGAFWILRVGFAALPFLMGLDKFFNLLTDWPAYFAPWIVGVLPFSAQIAMHVVGGIEMFAGVMVAIKPRYAAYVVALWLAGIIVNYLTFPGYFDVALRDVGLMVAALALGQLARSYDRPLRRSGRSGTSVGAR